MLPNELYGRTCRVIVGFKTVAEVIGRQLGGDAGANASGGLRIVFSIERSLKPEPNKCSIEIYNLAAVSRFSLEQLKAVPVAVQAGLGGNEPPTLFQGTLANALSVSEGQDVITRLDNGDGKEAYRGARANASFPKGTQIKAAVQTLAAQLGVLPGNLPALAYQFRSGTGIFSSGYAVVGPAAWELTHLLDACGKEWSIQNGAIQVLDKNQSVPAKAVLLSSDSGMVGSPVLETQGKGKGTIKVKCLMIADVEPGRLLVIQSKNLYANARIEKCTYNGDTHGDDWTIDIEAQML